MKPSLLPGTRQIDTITSDRIQSLRSFASNVANKKHPKLSIRHRKIWNFVSVILLLIFIQGVVNGQTVNLYLQSTQTQSGNGTFVRDLSLAQGTSGTVISNSTSSSTSAEMLAFTRDINNLTSTITGNSFPVSVSVNAISGNAEARFRLQRVNSSGSVISSTGFSSTFNNTGTKTATLSFTPAETWVSGDRLRLSIELRRTSGGGSRTITINSGNANSYVQYTAAIILSVSTLSDFGNQCVNGVYGPNSFTITGTNLTTADVTVGALEGFSYSTTSGGTYSSSLTLTQSGGAYSQSIYVKFSPTLVQSYNGNIPVSGGGAASVNVAASGSGINTPPTVTAGVASGITLTSATVPGTITVTGCSAITDYGVEYSITNGFANGTGTQVAGSNLAGGAFSVDLSGLSQGTPYYYHTYATNGGGTSYSTQGSFTTLSPSISTGSISGSPFCVTSSASAPVSVPFTSTGTFTGNTYTAQLSDASGSFASPVDIGSNPSDANSGTISATIPAGTANGIGYRIRVVSSNPVITGTNNGTNLTINLPSLSITPSGIQNIDAGANGPTLTAVETPVANSRVWAVATAPGGPYTNSSSTGTTYVPNFPTPGTYYIVCISTFDCNVITSNEVQVNSLQTITTGSVSGSPFCVTLLASTSVSVPYTSSGIYSGNTYTAQLSDASGSFVSPVDIGSDISDVNSGTINATIPAATVTGTGYRIRVISSSPVVIGADNGIDLTINLSTNRINPTIAQNINVGVNGSTLTVTETPAAGSRVWATSTVSGGPYTPTGSTGTTYVPNFSTQGTYFVVCISTFPCGTATSNQVQFNVSASITTGTIGGSPFCVTSTASSPVSVPFTSAGTFSSNTYTAQLSSSTGTWTSPTNIGSLTSDLNSGTISATIPAGTITGTLYRIRVISSSPVVTGTINGANLRVNLSTNSIAPAGSQNIDAGVNGSTLTVTETPAALSRVWATGANSGGPFTNTSSTGTSFVPNFALPGTYYVVCISTFSCGGVTSNPVQINVSASITTDAITGSPFCVTATIGAPVSVSFTSIGAFTGNTYTAQLSNSAGSFGSPIDIGTLVSDANSGTISATIPAGTTAGNGYRIRVISSNPALLSSDNGANLTINLPVISIAPTTTQNIDAGADGSILTVTETPGALSRVWATSTTSGGPYSNTTSTGTTYIPNFSTPGSYYVVCISTFACDVITSNQVIINVSASITTDAITGSPFCSTVSAGSSVSVPFTSIGTFAGNTYTAQLSNSAGSFVSPTNIGTLVSNLNSGTITASIPAGTSTGTGYRIRVISSNPALIGTDNGTNLTINLSSNGIAPAGVQNIGAGVNGSLLTVTETPAAQSRVWATSTVSGGPYNNTAFTGTTYVPNFSSQGTYYIVCVSTFTCGAVTSNEVQVNVSATVTTETITGSPFCVTTTTGSAVSVPFTSNGTFTGNTYTAQISNAAGSFTSPVNIGTLPSNSNSGTIIATIPSGTVSGTGYKIRVVSSSPAATGSDNGINLIINLVSNHIAPTTVQNIDVGVNGPTLTVTETPAALSREWATSSVSGGPYTGTGLTGPTFDPFFDTQGTYYVVCISTFSCGDITSNEVQVNVSATITTGTIAGSPFCVTALDGADVAVPFTSAGTFSGNTYTVQLSNASGSFTSSVAIGSLVSNDNSGTIIATIPQATPTGSGYRMRVVSSGPAITGTDNGTPLIINLPAISIAPTAVQNINAAVNGTTLTVTESPAANSRVWVYSITSGGPYNNIIGGATGTSYIPNFAAQGTYYIVCRSTFDCTTITSNQVRVNVSPTVTTGAIAGSPFCVTTSAGAAVSVPFTSAGTFSGNTYTAQLSNSAGSFTSPVTIGTLVSNINSGTISATIPANTVSGTGYRIRVISNNPVVTGTDNGTGLTINLPAISIGPGTTQNINVGVNGTPLTVSESPAANSRVWAYSSTTGGPYTNIIAGATGTSYTPNFAIQGTYYIVCISTFNCTTVTSNEVLVNVSATVATGTITGSPFCSTLTGGSPVSVPFTSLGTFTGNTYTAQLSNSSGSFTSAANIGTEVSDLNSGTISATIPAGTPTGAGYRIRVISSNPIAIPTDNGTNLTLVLPTVSILPSGIQNINVGVNGTTLTVTESPVTSTRYWATSTTLGGPYTTTGSTGTTFVPNFASQGTYYVVCISTLSCGIITSNEVQINVSGTLTTGAIIGSPFCPGSPVLVPFTSAGTFSGNTYTAELSNSSGSFASPTSIGTLVSDANSGTINATIPTGTASGSGYLIRVRSSNPTITGSNSNSISVNPSPVTTGVTICERGSGSLTSSSCPAGGTPTVGPNNAGTGTNIPIGGNTAWSNPGNITAVGTPYATSTFAQGTSTAYLQATGYGFSIPAGSTIGGIQVVINRNGTQTLTVGVRDDALYLVKDVSGLPVIQTAGNNMAHSTTWPTSFATDTYGSSSDLWGLSWTAGDINNGNFGVALSAHNNSIASNRTATVDYIQIYVTYTIPGNLNWYTVSSGGSIVQTGTTFNPINDPEVIASGAPYSSLVNTNTPGTYRFYAECSTQPGCRTATDFVILPAPAKPTVSPSGPFSICTTTGGSVTLTSSPSTAYQWYKNSVLIGGATSESYIATTAGYYKVAVSNGSCFSLPSDSVTVTSSAPVLTGDAAASGVCANESGTQISSLNYSATDSPTIYSITWSPALANVTDVSLTASPLQITVPANTSAGTYTGTLTVKTADGCISLPHTFTLLVSPKAVATFSYVNPGDLSNKFCKAFTTNPSPVLIPGAVAGTFSASSTGLKFVSTSTGQIDLTTSDPGVYTVTNTVNNGGCITLATSQVEIISMPAITISYAQAGYCNAITTPINVTRTPDGTISGSYSATPAGLDINGINDDGNPNAGQINPSLSLPGIYTVTYTFTNYTCSETAVTTVEIYTQPSFTTHPSTTPAVYCQGGTATAFTVAANAGGTATISNYEWFRSLTTSTIGGTSVGSDPLLSSYTPSSALAGSSPETYYYYCIVTNSNGCTQTSNISGSVTVNPLIGNNTISGAGQQVCSTELPSQLGGSVPSGGDGNYTYEWRTSTDDINFNTIVGTGKDFSPGLLPTTTYFRRTVTSGGCTNTTPSLVILVIPGPADFPLTGTKTICWGESSDIVLTGSEAEVTYQLRDASNNPIGTPVNGDGFPITFPTGTLYTTTTFNVFASSTQSGCFGQLSQTVTITVIPAITDNTISSLQATVCPGAAAQRLTGSIPLGGVDNFSYKWQFSTDNFLTYSDAPGVNDGQNYFPGVITRDTWYRRVVTSNICASISNIYKLSMGSLPAPVSVSGSNQFCGSTTLTASNGGDGIIYFQGTISGSTNTNLGGTPQTVSTSGTYYFRAWNPASNCWGPEGSITVALTSSPSTVGAIVCQGSSGELVSASIPPCSSPVQFFAKFPGTGNNITGIGTIGWTNPGNIITAGSPYAVASAIPNSGGITNYLVATNYGFSIPADADIYGITVTINRSSTGNTSPYIRDNTVQLVRGNTIVGNNRANAATDWPVSMGTATYGDQTDTWGITGLTAADINSSGFGVALSAINSSTELINPIVATTATSDEPNNTNSHSVTLPAGISAGDLLIVFWSDRQRTGSTVTTPSGWTQLYYSLSSGDSRRIAWYKVATGSEVSPLTISSTGTGIRSAHNAYRIAAGTYQGVPIAGSVVSGSSTSPNPPSLTSTFGLVNTLWIAASHSNGANPVTAPSGYSNLITGYSGATGTSEATMATAYRFLKAATEDPGAFTISPTGEWAANTVAVQGAPIKMDASVDYVQVSVAAQVNGVLNWYTSAVGGTFMGSGTPFNPVGKPGGLTDTNTPGTYSYYSECSTAPGCRTKTDFIVDALPIISGTSKKSYNGSDLSCNTSTDGEITVTASGISQPSGSAVLMYSKDNGAAYQASNVFSGLAAGIYNIKVRNVNLCESATNTVTISPPAAIIVSNVSQSVIACNGGTATVTITATGGTGILSYTFDGVTNTTGVFTHAAGTGLAYSVTDANNCGPVTGTFTIVQPAAISVSNVSQSVIACNGGTATVTITATGGTGILSYTFDGVTNTTGVFTHAAGTNLAYSVTDANNCTAATGTFTIVQPAAISVSNVSQSVIACNGGTATVTITATGGTGILSYTFDGVTNTTGVFTHAAGTNLAYSVTDANNCTAATGTFTIVQPAAISVSNVSQSVIACNGGTATVTITATGGTGILSYTFDGVTNTTGVFTHAAGTGLAYSVTDANNCGPVTGTFTIVEPAAISVSNVSQSVIACNGGTATVTITATGGTGILSYTFDGVTNTTGVFTHAAGVNLAYTVTDVTLCSTTGTFTIVEPAAISVSTVSQSVIACNGGTATVTITATGGTGILSYTFDGVTNTTGVFTHAAGTNLAYSVTDANNCGPVTGTFTIVEPAAISVSNVSQSVIACNGGTATVTITATGGTGILSYTFDGVTNTTGVFTHAAGTGLAYSVNDANNCGPVTGTFTIVQPAAISVSNVSQSVIACNGGTATVTITATGGTGILSYTFDGVTNTTGVFTHAAGTNLAYSVTDANNCTAATGTFTIVEPVAISVSNVSQSVIACNGGTATVTITATGGTGILSYTFDGVTNTTGVFTHAAGVNLAYTVTDVTLCSTTGTFTIVQPAAISVSNVSQSVIACNGGTATVTITATGGTGILSYTFDGVTNTTGVFTHAAGTNLAYSVTDANNCGPVTGTFTIVQPAAISVSNVSQSVIACNGGTATVTITATGGTGILSYTFDGVTNTTGVFTHAAGTNLAYSVTDANNCTAATGTFTIVQPAAISVSNVSQSVIACNGGTATVTITATGGTGILSYTFDGVTNTTGVFTHAAGTGLAYSVTDANNCGPVTGTFTIVQPAAISVSNVSQSVIACNGGTATVTITATGGTGILSYTFDGVTNTTGVFTHAAGVNLAYTVTDVTLCSTTGTFTIVEPAAISVSNVSQSVIACNGGTATVTITATGGTGILSYTFDGVTNTTGVFTHAAGTGLAYSVTDANNCGPVTGTFTIVQPAAISVSNVSQSVIACNGGTATVTITATGGTGILSYTFDGVTNTTGVFTHAAGTGLAYSVTDANNCGPVTGTFTIVQPAAISVSNVSQSVIACNGGTATVTITATGGTGILSYTFDGVTNTTGVFTHAAGTNLAYSVTDANNCTAATGTFTIVQPAAISASNVSQSVIACNGGTATVTITATGGTGILSYTFDGVTNTTGVFTHAAGTNLAYSVTDANNCTAATGTFTIVQPAAISVSNVSQSVIACNGGTATVTITATGGTGILSYTFDGVTNTTGVFTHAAGTNLAYSVTDANNCTAATGTFTIVEPAAISVSNVSQSVIACNGGTATVTITATGGTGILSYTFDGVTNTTGVFTHAAGTNLAYSVTDANNCTAATGTFTIVQPAAISVSNVSQSVIACNGGTATVTITATGGTGILSYTFDGVTNTTGVFTHAAGTGLAYSVTDANNCGPVTGTFTIVQPAAISVSNVSQSVIACNGGTATVTITATGGTGILSYTFDGVTNTTGVFTHAAGTGLAYSVTDANNCGPVTGTFTIVEPAAISVSNVSQSVIACNGGTATVTITATGGTGILSYTFDGVTNTTGVFTHAAGTGLAYSVNDANNCGPVTGTFTIVQPAAISVSNVSQSVIACNGGTATVTITATGGTGILSYTFDGVTNTTGVFTHAAGTNLAYSVTDANNCTAATGTFTIVEPAAISVSTVSQSVIACNGGTATVTITATGGTGILSYTFDGVTNTTGVFTHAAGTNLAYSVTDANNCTAATGTFTIVQPAAISVSNVSQSVIACNGGTATVTITATGGTGILSYTFDGVTNTTGVFTHAAGTGLAYSVTDANNCGPVTGTFTIVQPAAISVSNVSQSVIACNGGTATVTITATGGTGILSYTFDGVTNTTGVFTHAAGTNLAYSVTDANNCTAATGTFTIVQPAAIIVSNVSQSVIACNGGTATVTITATGGTGILSYTFDGVTNTTGVFTHAAGTGLAYSVTDANNCGPVTGTFTIVQPAAISVSNVSQSVIACNGGTATVTITATGGTGILSYTFDGVTNTTGVFTHAAGTNLAYSVTDANNCTAATGTFTIVQPAAISVSNVSQSVIACNGGTATVTITATGGTGILSYTFDGVTNTTGVFTHAAGTGLAYSVTDANNCGPVTGTFTIVQPAAISVSNVSQSVIACNGGTATVTITATGGTGILSYTFDGVTNTTGVFTHAAGTGLAYSVTDANNCGPVTGTFTIVQPAAISVSNVSQSVIACNGGTATVTITATGGTGILSYTFDGVTNTTGVFTHAAGTGLAYSVTDANNCGPVTGTFTIVQPAAISVSNVSQSVIACNGGTATVTITATGGTGILSYTFDGVTNTTGVFTHAAGTNLAYSVTDANNCGPVTGTLNVTQPAVLALTSALVTSPILCNGGTATVTIVATGGTAPISYTFNGTTNTTGVFAGVPAGTALAYTITDANSCGPVTGTLNVTQPAVLALTSALVTSPILCNGGTATVTIVATGGTAPISYTFNGTTNTTGVFAGVPAGTALAYTITDANSCGPVTGTLNVTQPAVLALTSALVTSPILCNGGTATVTIVATGGTAPISYTFNGTTNTTGVFAGVPAGTALAYTITDANSCGPVTGTLNVTQPAVLALTSALVTSPILCNGGTATVAIVATGGTAPISYTFSGTTNTTGVFAGVPAGTALAYTITDANSCGPVTGTLNVTQPAVLALTSALVTSPILCNGGTATVTIVATGGTAPISYTFNGTTNTTGVFAGVPAGTAQAYSITDANSCGPVSGTINVIQPVVLTGSASVTTAIICNGGTGTVTLTGAGGTAPLSYTFNGVTNSTGIFTGIPAGTAYPWSITDANNCGPVTGTLNVTQPAVVTVTSASVTPSTVCGSGAVTFSATASSGIIIWYDALTGGNVVTPPATVNSTLTLYAEAQTPQGCLSAARTPVTVTVTARPALPVAGANTYTYNGSLRTATATVGVNEAVDWYTAATGGSLTTAPSGINAGSYTAWAEARNTITGCLSASRLQVTLTINPVLITVTADAKTKIYGNTDPALTYRVTSGALVGTDAFSGALTRTAGENVGNYPILQGTLTLGANYTISYVGANLTITTRAITITADAKTKLYGTTDPALTYRITSGSLAANGDAFSGALRRDAGENVGIYPIRQGTLALNNNYTITYIGANLTITSMAVTVTANAQTKVYGNADPVLTYTITSGALAGTDAFTGTLTRDAGENVGTYPIRQGTLALNSNYALTFIGANLTITVRPVTVTADAKTKVYGAADPVLTYQVTSGSLAANGDAFSGSLTRDPGENVGTYAILQGTLSLGSNYNLTYIGANLTITSQSITVTADNVSRMYGDPDNLTYQITSGALAPNDSFIGSLAHAGGEDVGTHAITQGTLALSSNYTFTFVGATLTITPRPVTVTADALTKVYGDADPTLSYTLTSGSLAFSDQFSGTLVRVAGEDVGTYAISQGDLALNSNYILTFVGGDFTIAPRPITVTADPKTKIYGESDPVLTYQITSGNLAGNGDSFSGSLTREPGEDVGTYAITRGDLALSSNYILTFVGADFNIVKSTVSITVAADPATKVYGEADPGLTYQIVSGSLIGSDTFTGTVSRQPGENAGKYAITQGTLALSDNYDLIFVSADFTITRRPITVTADSKSKVIGETDPKLTYEITSGELVGNGDAFTGALARATGEGIGTYAINQGTLVLNDNYDLTFVGANLEITQGFEIHSYPNPFTDQLYLEFDLNSEANVLLEVFNNVGVKLATLHSGILPADHYRFVYAPEHMAGQVIIYRLTMNGTTRVIGKAIHMR